VSKSHWTLSQNQPVSCSLCFCQEKNSLILWYCQIGLQITCCRYQKSRLKYFVVSLVKLSLWGWAVWEVVEKEKCLSRMALSVQLSEIHKSDPISCILLHQISSDVKLFRRNWAFGWVSWEASSSGSVVIVKKSRVRSYILHPASYIIIFPWMLNFRRSWASGWAFWEASSTSSCRLSCQKVMVQILYLVSCILKPSISIDVRL